MTPAIDDSSRPSTSEETGGNARRAREPGPGSGVACLEGEVVSLERRSVFRPGSGRRPLRGLRAQVGGVPRLADRWLLDRPARASFARWRFAARSACSKPGRGSTPTFPRSLFAPAATETARARRISSTWAIPAAGPSRFAIAVGSRSIGPMSTSGVPTGLLPLPMPSRDGSIDLLRPYVNLTER